MLELPSESRQRLSLKLHHVQERTMQEFSHWSPSHRRVWLGGRRRSHVLTNQRRFNRRPSAVDHQPLTINHHPSTVNRRRDMTTTTVITTTRKTSWIWAEVCFPVA